MNIIVSHIEELPVSVRKFARPVPGGYEIDQGRVLGALTGTTMSSGPNVTEADGQITIPREDARDVRKYRAARNETGGDLSRLRIR